MGEGQYYGIECDACHATIIKGVGHLPTCSRVRRDVTSVTGSTAEELLLRAIQAVFPWHTMATVEAYFAASPELRTALERGLEATPDPDRPEKTCGRCGRPNPVWFAPSPVWNAAMRANDNLEERHGIICPPCFAEIAEDHGIAPPVWEFRPGRGLEATPAPPEPHYLKPAGTLGGGVICGVCSEDWPCEAALPEPKHCHERIEPSGGFCERLLGHNGEHRATAQDYAETSVEAAPPEPGLFTDRLTKASTPEGTQ